MARGRHPRASLPDSRRLQREGAIEGGEITRSAFAAAITRRRLAELVGISPATVRRWELAGLIRPRREVIQRSPTYVFNRSDVEFGRRLISLLRKRNGELSLDEAAEIVRARGGR